MAVRSVYVSDLSGAAGAQTITLGHRDTWYEVDLTPEEIAQLEAELRPYIGRGRKVGERRSAPANRFVPETTQAERDVIRTWARENGYELAERGKVPNRIYFAYQDAHPDHERVDPGSRLAS